MKIKILGAHNSESTRTRQTAILIDDVLALDAGALTSTLSFRAQMKIKAVLLTHGHYDHIRDIPALAMNFFLRNRSFSVYTHRAAGDNLIQFLSNGDIYPRFHERPEGNPTIRFNILQPLQQISVEGYTVMPVMVNHSIPAMGYQITSNPEHKTIFYTGDTGTSLSTIWECVEPRLLIIEVTASNQWAEYAAKVGHLAPVLLEQELLHFHDIKGYLPEVIAVHLNPLNEKDLTRELAAVAQNLGTRITPAHEGMVINF